MTDNSFHTPGFGWANNSKAVNLHPNTIKLSSSTDFDLFTGLLNELPTEFIVDLTKLSSILQDSLRTYFGNSEHHNDYEEFLLTGKSGGRVLRWNLMDIKANSSFQLHAHPNIELILVLSGVMNEYRLKGPAPKRNFTKDDKEGPNLKGIGLSSEEAFEYRRTPAISDTSSQEVGDRLIINEKGSIHITFTKEEGCLLLVLWSGGHANIPVDKYPDNFHRDVLVHVPNIDDKH